MIAIVIIMAFLLMILIFCVVKIKRVVFLLEERINFLEKYSLKDEEKIEIDHANIQLQEPKDK